MQLSGNNLKTVIYFLANLEPIQLEPNMLLSTIELRKNKIGVDDAQINRFESMKYHGKMLICEVFNENKLFNRN